MEKHLNQDELASAVGSCRKSISNIECGRRNPSIEMALRLAAYLDVSVEMIFQVDE
ncbi:MAG: helix-turn-helix domain-containing protein [Clostridiales bacterium]|nr:helix-turn-helix domain-containing protein [Clostridiales bacterium]